MISVPVPLLMNPPFPPCFPQCLFSSSWPPVLCVLMVSKYFQQILSTNTLKITFNKSFNLCWVLPELVQRPWMGISQDLLLLLLHALDSSGPLFYGILELGRLEKIFKIIKSSWELSTTMGTVKTHPQVQSWWFPHCPLRCFRTIFMTKVILNS